MKRYAPTTSMAIEEAGQQDGWFLSFRSRTIGEAWRCSDNGAPADLLAGCLGVTSPTGGVSEGHNDRILPLSGCLEVSPGPLVILQHSGSGQFSNPRRIQTSAPRFMRKLCSGMLPNPGFYTRTASFLIGKLAATRHCHDCCLIASKRHVSTCTAQVPSCTSTAPNPNSNAVQTLNPQQSLNVNRFNHGQAVVCGKYPSKHNYPDLLSFPLPLGPRCLGPQFTWLELYTMSCVHLAAG